MGLKLPEDIASELLKTGKIKPQQTLYEFSKEKPVWMNPYRQGTKAARKHTLEVTMNAIIEQAIICLQKHGYKDIPEARAVENDISCLYFMVIDGLKPISTFKQNIEQWIAV